jgi:hypothetical protein
MDALKSFVHGDFQLSMWIPSDSGTSIYTLMFIINLNFYFSFNSGQSNWKKRCCDNKFTERN